MTAQAITLKETSRHLKAFDTWYANDRSYWKTASEVGFSEQTIFQWARSFSWTERADRLDTEARQATYRYLIAQRSHVLQRQFDLGMLLMTQALDYLEKHPISDEKNAITAAARGSELARQAVGVPDDFTLEEDGSLIPPPPMQINVSIEAHEQEVASAAEEVLRAILGAVQGKAAAVDAETDEELMDLE